MSGTEMSTGAIDAKGYVGVGAATGSLQSYTELIYVKEANDLLLRNMDSLNKALGVTENITNALAALQNLKNEVTPNLATPSYAFHTGFTTANTAATYAALASVYFAQTVNLVPAFINQPNSVNGVALLPNQRLTPSAYFMQQMGLVYAQLNSCSVQLRTLTQSSGPTSLLGNINAVLTTLNHLHAVSTLTGAINWLQDNYTTAGQKTVTSTGVYNQQLTTAITAAGALNTTQTESVRNYLYVYQQYFASASAVLAAMTKIIEHMASGISK